MAAILSGFPVEDFNVTEIPLEESIARFYQKEAVHAEGNTEGSYTEGGNIGAGDIVGGNTEEGNSAEGNAVEEGGMS